MNRQIFYAQIGGTMYPLIFSLGAKKQLKNVKKQLAALQKYSKSKADLEENLEINADAIDAVSTLADIMIRQGVAYLNKFHKNYKPPQSNKYSYKNGIWKGICKEDIELITTDEEFNELFNTIVKAFSSGSGSIKTKSKNETAIQGEQS